MHTILVVAQVLVAVSLIGLILIQHGKGADAGAAFGSGASGTVFGARGAANFLTRLTAILATVFFIASLSLAYLVSDRSGNASSVVDSVPASVPAEASESVPGAESDAAMPVVPEDESDPQAAGDAPVVPE